MKKFALLFTAISASLFGSYTIVEDKCTLEIKTPSLQDIQKRKIVLPNGLQAYIISDPQATKSSAALSVGAGQWHDPKEYPGTAHFLEHMLFMGTKRFPDEEGYHKFIQDHGGANNAYTAFDKTVYGASIQNEYFVELLDRLSDFFVDPLLSISGVEREFKAVDSENTNCKAHDGWRNIQVIKTTARDDHPFSSFAVGNAETLGQIPPETLRGWFEEHYSPESMNVAIYSPLSCDELSEAVAQYFSRIPTRKTAPPYKAEILSSDQKGHLLVMKPLKSIQEVEMIWEMPQTMSGRHTLNMLRVIAKALNSKEPGSLYDRLNKKQAIESLHAVAIQWSKENNLFAISASLSDWGLENREWVVDTIFQAINTYQRQSIPQHVYDELETMERLSFEFTHRPSNSFSWAMDTAAGLFNEPIATYPQQTFTLDYYDAKLIDELLSQLTPQSALFTLTADMDDFAYDKVERFYEVPYSLLPMEKARLNHLAMSDANDPIELPKENRFIPQNLEIFERTSKRENNDPYLLSRNRDGMLYYKLDDKFLTPNGEIHLAISTPLINPSKESMVKMDIAQVLIDDKLVMSRSLANAAGVRSSISASADALFLNVTGFSEKAPDVTLQLVEELKDLTITEKELALYKELLLTQYLNSKKELPVRYGFDLIRSKVLDGSYPADDKIAYLESVKLADMQRFIDHLFNRTFIRAYMTGNLDPNQAAQLFAMVARELDSEPLAYSEIPRAKYNPVENVLEVSETSESMGYSAISMIHLGEYTPHRAAIQSLLQTAIHTDFFDELRSRQQLGYIVASQGSESKNHLNLYFYIQSGNTSSNELFSRYQTFLNDWLTNFEEVLSEQRFNELKASTLTAMKMPYNNLSEMAATHFGYLIDHDANFSKREEDTEALEALDYPTFKKEIVGMISDNNTQRINVLVEGVNPIQQEVQ